MGNRTSRCEPGKSVCSAKWEFRNVDCAKLPNEDARDICAQSMVDCEKTECKIIAQPEESIQNVEKWRIQSGVGFWSVLAVPLRLRQPLVLCLLATGLVHHVGNSAWECNMSAGQYAVKAAFDAAVKLPVIMSCLRVAHVRDEQRSRCTEASSTGGRDDQCISASVRRADSPAQRRAQLLLDLRKGLCGRDKGEVTSSVL